MTQTVKPTVGGSLNTWGTELNAYLLANRTAATVLEYGATGDGTTDDTTAIQDAIDDNEHDIIVFPIGTYIISSALSLTDNITLLLCKGATLYLADSSDDYMIKNDDTTSGNSGITICGEGIIDANKDNNTGHSAIYLIKCTNTRIYDVEIKNASIFGIDIRGS